MSPVAFWRREKAVCYDTLVTRPFLLLLLVASLALGQARTSGSVVVLPLVSEAHDSNDAWIGESVAETLADLLNRNRVFVLDREERLRVTTSLGVRDHAMRTLATNLKIATELDADIVVFGAFLIEEGDGAALAPPRIRLALSVMDVRRWRRLADLQVEGALTDLGQVETRAAFLVLKTLDPADVTMEADFLNRYPQVRLDAKENYVRGLLADSEETRHRYFTQAMRLEEDYAAPAFRLAALYWQRRNYQQAAAWLSRIDSQYPRFREVQFMLSVCLASLGRYQDAEALLRLLYAEAPLPEVANNLAVVLARRQVPGALELLLFAIHHEPDDPDYRFNLGHALWMHERYDDAAERFREALELAGEDSEATRMLGRCLQGEASRPARTAVSNLNRLKEEFNDTVITVLGNPPPLPVSPAAPETVSPQ